MFFICRFIIYNIFIVCIIFIIFYIGENRYLKNFNDLVIDYCLLKDRDGIWIKIY